MSKPLPGFRFVYSTEIIKHTASGESRGAKSTAAPLKNRMRDGDGKTGMPHIRFSPPKNFWIRLCTAAGIWKPFWPVAPRPSDWVGGEVYHWIKPTVYSLVISDELFHLKPILYHNSLKHNCRTTDDSLDCYGFEVYCAPPECSRTHIIKNPEIHLRMLILISETVYLYERNG